MMMIFSIEFSKNLLTDSETRKDITQGVISIDSSLLNSMRNGKKCEFSWAKNGHH